MMLKLPKEFKKCPVDESTPLVGEWVGVDSRGGGVFMSFGQVE